MDQKFVPLMVTIPHSGEAIPEEATWLQGLPETILMCDVDRFVDQLYGPALKDLGIPHVIAKWHRYSGDLNRLPEDVDASTVVGNLNPAGKFSRGFLWAITTKGQTLMKQPVDAATFEKLVKKYFDPFHQELKKTADDLRAQNPRAIYHIDAHSMPSVGTKEHRDPGELRADFVISDQLGKSCSKEFLDLVVSSYKSEGFSIKVNWPYIGGRITETYGRPVQGHHTVQVEMNRALYMNEETKRLFPEKLPQLQGALTRALKLVQNGLLQN